MLLDLDIKTKSLAKYQLTNNFYGEYNTCISKDIQFKSAHSKHVRIKISVSFLCTTNYQHRPKSPVYDPDALLLDI